MGVASPWDRNDHPNQIGDSVRPGRSGELTAANGHLRCCQGNASTFSLDDSAAALSVRFGEVW